MSFKFLLLLASLCSLTYGEPLQSPSPSPTEDASDSSFISLPALDLSGPSPDQTVQVGDRLKLTVLGSDRLQSSESPLSIEFTEASDWNFEQISEGSKTNLIKDPLNFFAVPLKPGKLTLPSFPISINGKKIARTNPLTLNISSAIRSSDPKPQEPEGPEGPILLNFPWWLVILMGIFGLFFAGGLCFLLYRWIKKRRSQAKIKNQPKQSEDQEALNQLQLLARENYLEKGYFKLHYFKISEILKEYLGARFGFDALESTTGEILSFLKAKNVLSPSQLASIQSFFEHLDQVKFTDLVPSGEQSHRLIEQATQFVVSTKRIQIVPDLHKNRLKGSSE